MKYLMIVVLTTLSISAAAGEFSFKPHRPFLSQQTEYISAALATPTAMSECMVDTGARFSIGKDSVFGHLEKIGQTPGGGISNMNLMTDLVQTDISVGDWKIPQAVVGRSHRIPYECLIGNDFFIGRAFTINFKTNRISEEESSAIVTRPLDVYLSDRGGHFGFAVQIAKYSTNSIFDTGSSHTVIDQKIVDLNPADFKFVKDLSATDGNGQKIKVSLYQLKSFQFGTVELKNIQVLTLDLSPLTEKISGVHVVFGLDIIQNFKWSFDTKSKTWSHETP